MDIPRQLEERIGGWAIQRLWRSTAFADHYIATRGDARAFLRVLRPSLGSEPEAILRHGREVRLLSGFVHEGVLPVVDHGITASGDPWLATAWVRGRLLRQRLETGPLRWRSGVRIATQVARVLAAAHDHGWVHRDLRPAHVLVSPTQRVWVLDFDLVHHDDGLTEITDLGQRVGAAAYMSPEYVEHGRLDARSDLYSLGVMLYELACGEPPFTGREHEVLRAQVDAPVPPHPRLQAAPEAFQQLVARLLSKDPSERPSTAQHVAVALGRLQQIPRRANSLPPDSTAGSASA